MRLPFFIAAVFCLVLVVLCEVAASDLLVLLTGDRLNPETPGIGIKYLAIWDGLLLYNILLMTLGAGTSEGRNLVGRMQGPVTLVLSFFGFLGALLLIFVALGLLMLMISLLVAVPFGTIAYIAAFGHFATAEAGTTLLIIMVLKIAFCVLLLLAHQGFLKFKGLLVVTGLSLLWTWLLGFLHAFPPGFLVSIADAIGALVISIIGTFWLLLLLLGSLGATLKGLTSLGRG